MYGINVGFEIGKRALLAQQYALNLTGHNIANVNTPGFTRQQAIIVSTEPMRSAKGNFGTGVEVTTVRHLRAFFLDEQFRRESQDLGRWQTLAQSWSHIETIYMEPSDTGFSALLDDFWNSWQDLSANPDDQAARVAIREQANLVVNAFHHFAEQLKSFQRAIDEDIQNRVLNINNIAYQLSALNDSITTAELTGHSANDLRDRRDYLVDELSRYVNVQVIEQPTGAYSVLIGSMVLVDRNEVCELETVVEEQGVNIVHKIQFKSSKIQPDIIKGELAGLIEVRDEIIPERLQELDALAVSLVERLNQLHREGYGLDGVSGRDFFDASTTGAEDIKLDDMIIQSEAYIAASLNGEVGDNSNALRIAALRTELTMRGGTATFGDYYNSLVGIVGIRTREAQNMAENQESLVFHIENNRQAVEGVSLDEEMTNLIKYQHAYEAAARVITTMDEALDTIINGMGIVGR